MPIELAGTTKMEAWLKRLGPRVVIADDSQDFREFLAYVLAFEGVNIVGEAADGEEAFHVVSLFRPDLVLIDVEMPRVDGLQATRCIKEHLPGARVILLSATASPKTIEAARRSGADAFLDKMALPTALIAAIQEVVSRSSFRQAPVARAAS